MGPQGGLLLDWLDHVFEHEGWHVSLLDAVKELGAHQAAWTPSPERNSIWKIVEHVALWKEEGARRILAQPPRPAGWAGAHDWRSIGDVSDARWQAAVQRLIGAHAAIRSALTARPDLDLNTPPPGSTVTIIGTIRGLVLHDSYHCGQICYLRAMQGIPAKIW